MRKIIVLTIAMVLFAGSAFAAGAQKQPRGTQRNVTSVTDANDTVVVSAGTNNRADIGVVGNKSGRQENVTNLTRLDNTTVVTSGRGNAARIGTVSND